MIIRPVIPTYNKRFISLIGFGSIKRSIASIKIRKHNDIKNTELINEPSTAVRFFKSICFFLDILN